MAELWSRFVSTLRLTYWEQLQPLPRMRLGGQQQAGGGGDGSGGSGGGSGSGSSASGGGASGGDSGPSSSRPEAPNLELCLLHQKLQLLDLCIHLQAQRQQAQQGEQGEQRGGGRARRPQRRPQRRGQDDSEQAALQWEASWGDEEEPGEAGQHQQGSQAALDWEASWGESDSNRGEGQQEAHSPSSSSSSYHSARAGSEASLSPAREQRAAAASPPTARDAPQQARGSSSSPARVQATSAAEPQGLVGELPGATLHLHPSRPLRIPAVQEPPVHTEDTLAESHAALQVGRLAWGWHPLQQPPKEAMRCRANPGGAPLSPLPLQWLPAGDRDAAALRSQLQGRLLASDMQAFKAANPGACLLGVWGWLGNPRG